MIQTAENPDAAQWAVPVQPRNGLCHRIRPVRTRICRLFLALVFAACSRGLALDIVRDGKASATVVVARDAGMWQRAAAAYLRDYVQEATGCRLTMVTEGEGASGNLVCVGRTQRSVAAGIETSALKWDGCRLVARGNVLFLVGRDVEPLPSCKSVAHLRGAGAQGTAKAVALFLERFVGVRWFLPAAAGIVIPDTRSIIVPDSYESTFEPTFAYTSLSIRYPRPLDHIAMNQREAIRFRSFGGHSWYQHVPVKKYFDQHPEYFWLAAGGSRTANGEHLCTTSAEVRRIILREIRELFDSGYDVVQLGQTDGWRACLCAPCMTLDEHIDHRTVSIEAPCNKVWDMHQWIIDRCKRSHPDKMLRVMIYGPTWAPPKDWPGQRDNVIGEIAPITPERIAAWQGKLAGITNWTYWWHAATIGTVFVPATPPEFLQERFRQFRDMNVIGMVGDPQGQWGLGGPSHYVFCQLIGNVDADVDALVHDYCMGVYGEVGWLMKRFFRTLHERAEMTVPLKELHQAKAQTGYPAEETFMFLYPPKIVRRLERLLQRAEQEARTARTKHWLQLTRDEFDGLKAVVTMFVHKRSFELEPSRERLVPVKRAVDDFEAWRERILFYPEEYVNRWRPQHNELCAILLTNGKNMTADWTEPDGAPSYYRYHYRHRYLREEIDSIKAGRSRARGRGIGSELGNRAITAPVTWDFKALEANIGKPERTMRCIARRTPTPVALDGRLGPNEWQGAEKHPFQRYQAAGSRLSTGATTDVRLMYDDRCLYVGYTCREPNIEQLKLVSVNRDGNVYHNDEVELFLNPDPASDRKVMQFMASPVDNAFYDARKGFIEDPLHPGYSSWEKTTWNPAWHYAFDIDTAGREWSLEVAMPFQSIGADTPLVGTVWTCNFARARRAGADELSSWIPDTFGSNPELFGELVFGDAHGKLPEPPAQSEPTGATPADDDGNLVRNSSFELAAVGGTPGDWQFESYPQRGNPLLLDRCLAVRQQAHRGERSLLVDFSKVDFSELPEAGQIYFGQSLSSECVRQARGKTAKLSFWVYYEAMGADIQDYYLPGPLLRVRCWDKQRKLVGPDKAPAVMLNYPYLTKAGLLAAVTGPPRWLRFEHTGYVPEDTVRMDIHADVVGCSKHSGKVNGIRVFIDDIRLELRSPEQPSSAN